MKRSILSHLCYCKPYLYIGYLQEIFSDSAENKGQVSLICLGVTYDFSERKTRILKQLIYRSYSQVIYKNKVEPLPPTEILKRVRGPGISVAGNGHFCWKKRNCSWDKAFIHLLFFDWSSSLNLHM